MREAGELVRQAGFEDVELSTRLGSGDLLLIEPSRRYQGALFRLIWSIYPRWLVRRLGDRFGLYLLIEATRCLRAVGRELR